MDELVKGHFEHFTDVCAQVEQKAAEKSAAQDEAVAANFDHFTSLCTELSAALDSTSVEHQGRMDELGSKLEHEHEN